ncbi:hypothetical protein SAMN04487866_10926 [Thermoactinomyces sp. DSM 45891]|uniref:hypothetical protein n=1 Tax=Thermoactinomyces sp. DSM 45891 TaxID=1761907 RepID=UPI000918D86B|nr:hypothetical protein [Thermoactinomyces sp. DSM 45891]SFX47922.1 hypothetical protein SAMN04487866_10926 [Thermoactinomyces sp. DSM 45891]
MKLTNLVDESLLRDSCRQPVAGSELAHDFLTMMDKWHSYKEIWDDDLDADILRMNLEILTTNRKKLDWGPKGTGYFTPSSSSSDARELYMKLTKAPRDEQEIAPHQKRWQRAGTAFGDIIQDDLLYINKHYISEFKEQPTYRPEFVDLNGKLYPSWERFARKIMWIKHRGHQIPILGQPDGILWHHTGKRVGLEIKTKQTTAARTSHYSMREPSQDHIKQCICYSIMYGVDDYLIVYGNLAKKAWNMTKEDYEKTPDLRVFHIKITDEDRKGLLDFFADILDCIDAGIPPKLDLDKWMFNNFKTACALSLSQDELTEITQQVSNVSKSQLPEWKKRQYTEALEFINEVRSNS